MKQAYADSFSYEAFMRRAFQSSNEKANDPAHNTVYLLLDHIRGGYRHAGVSYDKHFDKVRKLLLKGADKVLKWKLTAEERSQVLLYQRQIEQAAYEDTLMQAISGLLDTTQRFKEY